MSGSWVLGACPDTTLPNEFPSGWRFAGMEVGLGALEGNSPG
jgi:hypothetical protein